MFPGVSGCLFFSQIFIFLSCFRLWILEFSIHGKCWVFYSLSPLCFDLDTAVLHDGNWECVRLFPAHFDESNSFLYIYYGIFYLNLRRSLLSCLFMYLGISRVTKCMIKYGEQSNFLQRQSVVNIQFSFFWI